MVAGAAGIRREQVNGFGSKKRMVRGSFKFMPMNVSQDYGRDGEKRAETLGGAVCL